MNKHSRLLVGMHRNTSSGAGKCKMPCLFSNDLGAHLFLKIERAMWLQHLHNSAGVWRLHQGYAWCSLKNCTAKAPYAPQQVSAPWAGTAANVEKRTLDHGPWRFLTCQNHTAAVAEAHCTKEWAGGIAFAVVSPNGLRTNTRCRRKNQNFKS